MTLKQEVERRRTFAIISHPDAGKTTLTEKLLLYGGAIREAGSVKARRAQHHAVSDWMEIEKQRGISVTSSVMQFDYDGYRINILDTPGHQDFSEDTYRTLVAADSAVMLIDGARGVEAQTIKLFQVCKRRGIPIFTFVNKMDRASKSPFDLMAELEEVLGIRSCPITWPIGTDGDFKGVYHRDIHQLEVFDGSVNDHGSTKLESIKGSVEDENLREFLGEDYHDRLVDEIELLDVAGDPFDLEKVRSGELTPLFFGSAMNNFGVESFLEKFLKMTTPPLSRHSDDGEISPYDERFSGFIFKIQANMNPAHRDRIAFMRICSGKFEKGMEVRHMRLQKNIKLTQPQQFMAQDRDVAEEAWPGDIIGLFDPGIFALGDTLLTGSERFHFEGIPVFAPEHFARVTPEDSIKRKQFVKGVTQLCLEGAIQSFKRLDIGMEEIIVGVVGALQFEVLQHRLKHEYGVDIRLNVLPYRMVRWVKGTDSLDGLNLTSSTLRAQDGDGRLVLLFENEWSVDWAVKNNEGIELTTITDRD
ncbi:peptide chain release factor 3 [Gehongia tenuis]|uniref:Peptide chain release factor 3 n=1 Tax=Gehongia tenuis TaxID=2763655 RepID=A0A926HQM4_9FIRM|nr:peptide chain release factor 3 [Gehongia tenuis]MBC8531396.1 peptide chain release factor 3 [Gehongia tenuis]